MTWHYTAWHHTMSQYTDLTTPCQTSLHPSPRHDNAPWPTLTTPDYAILCCSQWLDTALCPTLTTPDYAMLYCSPWHDTTLHATTQLWLHHSRFRHIPLSMTWCYTRLNPHCTQPWQHSTRIQDPDDTRPHDTTRLSIPWRCATLHRAIPSWPRHYKYNWPEKPADVLIFGPHGRDDSPLICSMLHDVTVGWVALVPVLPKHVAHHGQELVCVVRQCHHQLLQLPDALIHCHSALWVMHKPVFDCHNALWVWFTNQFQVPAHGSIVGDCLWLFSSRKMFRPHGLLFKNKNKNGVCFLLLSPQSECLCPVKTQTLLYCFVQSTKLLLPVVLCCIYFGMGTAWLCPVHEDCLCIYSEMGIAWLSDPWNGYFMSEWSDCVLQVWTACVSTLR